MTTIFFSHKSQLVGKSNRLYLQTICLESYYMYYPNVSRTIFLFKFITFIMDQTWIIYFFNPLVLLPKMLFLYIVSWFHLCLFQSILNIADKGLLLYIMKIILVLWLKSSKAFQCQLKWKLLWMLKPQNFLISCWTLQAHFCIGDCIFLSFGVESPDACITPYLLQISPSSWALFWLFNLKVQLLLNSLSSVPALVLSITSII